VLAEKAVKKREKKLVILKRRNTDLDKKVATLRYELSEMSQWFELNIIEHQGVSKTFRDTLKDMRKRLDKLIEKQTALEQRIAELEKVICALAALQQGK
jgi:cell division protein FtsB